jgi:hypothetical protein
VAKHGYGERSVVSLMAARKGGKRQVEPAVHIAVVEPPLGKLAVPMLALDK